MYQSGVWRGFWEQEFYGRQPMESFELHFDKGEVTGFGIDIVGRFVMNGVYDVQSGSIQLTKHYLGKHVVEYRGMPDGEGSILGTWTVTTQFLGTAYTNTGSFLLRPEFPRPSPDDPIVEISKSPRPRLR